MSEPADTTPPGQSRGTADALGVYLDAHGRFINEVRGLLGHITLAIESLSDRLARVERTAATLQYVAYVERELRDEIGELREAIQPTTKTGDTHESESRDT